MTSPPRAPRADAVRNRARVIEAARSAFTSEGPDVPLDEIARRAGVGAGTVHRNFPTKESLLAAVIADRLERLTERAARLAGAPDPADAFFAFLRELAEEANENQALHAALDGAGIGDEGAAASAALSVALGGLLASAQQQGTVRRDVDAAGLHAILSGVLAAEHRLPASARGLGLQVVIDGLRAARRDA